MYKYLQLEIDWEFSFHHTFTQKETNLKKSCKNCRLDGDSEYDELWKAI